MASETVSHLAGRCLSGTRSLWQVGMEFVYPHVCPLCHRDIVKTETTKAVNKPIFCNSCVEQLLPTINDVCRRCDAPVGPFLDTSNGCIHCRRDRFAFEKIVDLIADNQDAAVLFENDEVQVLDLRYEPGSVTPLHTHEYPHRVLYIEAGGVLEILPGVKSDDGTLSLAADAEPIRVKLTAGQTLWLPAATHRLRNVGETFVRVIEVEVKISEPQTVPKVK